MKYLEPFFWGIIAALGALFLEFLALGIYEINFPVNKEAIGGIFFASIPFIVIASLIEESFKYIVIAKRIKLLFSGRSIIFASLFAGLSFSIFEIILAAGQIRGSWINQWQYLAEIIVLHVSTAGIIGYSAAVNNIQKKITSAKTILAVSVIHFMFNFLVLGLDASSNYIIILFLFSLAAINALNIARINQKLAS